MGSGKSKFSFLQTRHPFSLAKISRIKGMGALMALHRGEIFANRFEIDRAAGSGGMGAVYRARDQLSVDWGGLAFTSPHRVVRRAPEHGVSGCPVRKTRSSQEVVAR